uniref:Uncharacterized protein n=1 Tax=Globodera rostochiensis TaxID=31243 RepID=A0A914H4Z2_GLORO
MAVVFILMLSSATLEAQRNENDKFYDLMATIGEHFRGEFNDAKKVLELDLNGANAFLEGLHRFATHKIVEDLVKELSVKYSEEQLFNLLFSLAARLEALVHGKNIDGTLKEKKENSKENIQTFLAVPKCFILPESELNSIFDYWTEIIEMKTKNSQKPIFGVAIYKEKYDEFNKEYFKEKSFRFSQENYQILKQLNDQKLSIYNDKGIDPKLHLDSQDFKIQEYVQNDVEENCKKFENEEAQIIFLNKVHYELAINFEYNQQKEVYDRVEDLLSDWIGHRGLRSLGILLQLSKESYLKRNAFYSCGKSYSGRTGYVNEGKKRDK